MSFGKFWMLCFTGPGLVRALPAFATAGICVGCRSLYGVPLWGAHVTPRGVHRACYLPLPLTFTLGRWRPESSGTLQWSLSGWPSPCLLLTFRLS